MPLDLQAIFGKGQSVADKMSAVSSAQLEKANIPGLTTLATDVKSAVAGVVSRFTPKEIAADAKTSTRAAVETKTPDEAKDDAPTYRGALMYPINLKYYVKFSFRAYQRVSVLVDSHDLPTVDIILPIPANLQENFSLTYDTPALGPLVGAASEVLRGVRSAPTAGDALHAMFNEKTLGNLSSALGQVGYLGITAGISGYVDAIAKGKTGVGSAIAIAGGFVPNPHLAVIFSSTNLRRHSFRFLLTPNSLKEVRLVKEIVRTIKKRMLPANAGSSGLLFTFPDTVDITFGPEDNPVYKVKRCVLNALNVHYAPMASPAFFKSGDVVATMIDMEFTETEQFTREDVSTGVTDQIDGLTAASSPGFAF